MCLPGQMRCATNAQTVLRIKHLKTIEINSLKIGQILFYNLLGAKATFIRFFGQVNKTAIALGDRAALAKVDFRYGYY